MTHEEQVKRMTDMIAKFVGFTGKKLPDDVIAKLTELREKETEAMPKVIYDTMFRNQELAVKLDRPSCQDTGVLQFWVKCGTKFPLIDDLEALLKEAVVKATFETPLRHNSVETFDEYNTGKNVGKGTPTVWWDIVPHSDKCEIYTYMAGGGCTLPGCATVLMPGEGYEGVTKFVMDRMTSYGLNACFKESSDASDRFPQRERESCQDGEAPRGRHQCHRSRSAGHGRKVLRHGRQH